MNEAIGRKLLMTICNLEYLLSHSLPLLTKRLNDNGVKYCDLIVEVSLHRLRGTLKAVANIGGQAVGRDPNLAKGIIFCMKLQNVSQKHFTKP